MNISDTIHRALSSAGFDGDRARSFRGIRDTIDKALTAAGLARFSAGKSAVPGPMEQWVPTSIPLPHGKWAPETAPLDEAWAAAEQHGPGQFLSRSHASAHGNLKFRLYVPTSYQGKPVPLILMLHGCKQNPEDFAAGTRMNELAERHGFLVAYPAQSPKANGSNCWNWFDPRHQTRDGAEPALLAGIVGEISRSHSVDLKRVFVAGLSAGGAMAVILGRTHPEVFAAVAAHSGLPAGAAHDVPSAFAAMQGRSVSKGTTRDESRGVRTIVFHGDADATVKKANGEIIIEHAVSAFERHGAALNRVTRLEASQGGRPCTTTAYTDAHGDIVVEAWVVHGARHAWSGGNPRGSYTDASGPDASAEMVRFFLHEGMKA